MPTTSVIHAGALGDWVLTWPRIRALGAQGWRSMLVQSGEKARLAAAVLDPAAMKATVLPHPDTRPDFGDATAAVKAGGEVWIGANPTDKVAWMAAGAGK